MADKERARSEFDKYEQSRSFVFSERVIELSKAFNRRTEAVKAQFLNLDAENAFHDALNRTAKEEDEDDYCQPISSINVTAPSPSHSVASTHSVFRLVNQRLRADKKQHWLLWGTIKNGVIDNSTRLYRLWLLVLSMVFLYNFWSITLRATFPMYQSTENYPLYAWLTMDYTCDLLVLFDIIFIRPRIAIYEKGILVTDKKKLRRIYTRSWNFRLDVLSVLPLDMLYLAVGYVQPLFRLNRLFSIRTYFEMFERQNMNSSVPEIFRIIKTMVYIFMIVHLYTCVYYLISAEIGFGTDSFVFEGESWPAYSRCFFITFRIATRIGAEGKVPSLTSERAILTLFWLIALCVEIVLLAQVREIFLSVTRGDDEFRLLLSTALDYVRRYKCPEEIEKKVRDWFMHTKEHQKRLDEEDILRMLPKHLQSDIALDIHAAVLSKVSIFANCKSSIISDVLIKMKLELFFPDDIIYHKGDVGNRMYIIQNGQIDVIDDKNVLLATLSEGAIFGEQSLMTVGASNRRLLTVKSRGFSNLFVLSKDDFEEIMLQHPKLYRRIQAKASSSHDQNTKEDRPISGAVYESVEPIISTAKNVSKVKQDPALLKLFIKIWPRKFGRSKVNPLHAKRKERRYHNSFSSGEDSEISALPWSTPSPENFYIPHEWEMPHYNYPANDMEAHTKSNNKLC